MRGVDARFIIIDFISNTLIVLTSTRQEGSQFEVRCGRPVRNEPVTGPYDPSCGYPTTCAQRRSRIRSTVNPTPSHCSAFSSSESTFPHNDQLPGSGTDSLSYVKTDDSIINERIQRQPSTWRSNLKDVSLG